jgi:hypothetical protein
LSNSQNFSTRRFGGLTQILLALALGCVVVLLATAVFAPWGFYLGGHFHPIPYWQGWGKMHASTAGGDYVLFVRMEPSSRGSRIIPGSNLKGVAYLCTPKGERLRLSLGGTMARNVGTNLMGEKIHLYISNSPLCKWSTDRKPSLNFYGNWGDREIVADDHKSISTGFLPDGSVYRGHDRTHTMGKELVQVTIKEGDYGEFEAACAAKAR